MSDKTDLEKENLSPLFTGPKPSDSTRDTQPPVPEFSSSADWIEDDPNQLAFDDLGEISSTLQIQMPETPKASVPLLFQPTAPVEREEWSAPEVRIAADDTISDSAYDTTADDSDAEDTALELETISEVSTQAPDALIPEAPQQETDVDDEEEAIEWESASITLGNIEPTQAEADLALEDDFLKNEIAAIPQKLAFKIGEVAELVGVKQYVLRYWETEFEVLKPKKSRFNQRMYTRKDVEILLMIKKLLYKDRFSTEGARRALRGLRKQVRTTQQVDKQWDGLQQRVGLARERLEDLIEDVKRIRGLF